MIRRTHITLDGHFRFHLCVCDTRRRMQRLLDQRLKGEYSEYEAFFTSDIKRKGALTHPYIGTIYLHLEGDTMNSLTHECLHAALLYIEINTGKLNFGYKLGKQSKRQKAREEALAETAGMLVAEFWRFIEGLKK
ncbi:MAG: hypothetical protein C4574_00650 [Candidatus Latescibacterota bacterium]|jgi:hypothetical protein|nr:MAG: hypothetical protein C4574_00650 [Candidatus Latescibacterota bacterium]